MRKRYAAHYLFTPSSGYKRLQGVELADGYVVRSFPLTEETEATQWLPGIIRLEQTPEGWEAWHCYPFDFNAMCFVDGTRRTRLL